MYKCHAMRMQQNEAYTHTHKLEHSHSHSMQQAGESAVNLNEWRGWVNKRKAASSIASDSI